MRSAILISMLCSVAPAAEAAQVFLVLKPATGPWQVVAAEKVAVNNKEKVRIGRGESPQMSEKEYKRLPAEPLMRLGMVRRHAGGYLVVKNGSNWTPMAPDGANSKGEVSFAALWSTASVTMQRDKSSKSLAALRPGDLFAVLPGVDRNQALADFLTDASNFRGVGEKDASAAFEERMSLLVAVAPTLSGPPAERVAGMLLGEMESLDQKLSAGIAHKSDLDRGLQYVEVSEKAYPADEKQKQARAALQKKKEWLDRRIAILKAFEAGELWDAFLDKYGEFERWDNSFPGLREERQKAYAASAARHLAEGQRLAKAKQYALALRELKIAQARRPGDKAIGALVETVSIEDARSYSAAAAHPVKEDRTSPRWIQIRRHLQMAENFIGDKRLDDAEGEIAAAEALERDAPQVLLTRAKLLQARQQPLKALEMLDRYDRRVTDPDDIDAGDRLRTDIRYELRKTKEELKASITKGEEDGDYVQAGESAEKGLAIDSKDLDFLLQGGITRAILRKGDEGQQLLKEYLRLSQAPGNDSKERARIYNLLPNLKETAAEPQGTPNWFSGYRSPEGVFYCPVSLMPSAKISEVRGSRKLTVSYEWKGDRLEAIRSSSEQPGERGFNVFFDYFPSRAAVRRVSSEPLPDTGAALSPPRLTAKGPVGSSNGAYVVLLNYPLVDPAMVEKITGKRVATLVTGNPYFHPFVWSGVYRFLAEYDEQGRVKSAWQIREPEQRDATHVFDFTWDGLRLTEIRERGTGDYRRTMSYSGGRLTAETIVYHGKSSKIEYKYKGDRLMEASCGDDPSIDGRSRRVEFR